MFHAYTSDTASFLFAAGCLPVLWRPDMASIPQAHQFRNVPPMAAAFRNESTVASKKKNDNEEVATSKTIEKIDPNPVSI